METRFSIRKTEGGDLEQVMDINQDCLPENYSHYFFVDLYTHFPETFIVAEKDSKIVGYIMCRIETGFSSLRLLKKGHVISFAVLPEFRNLGVGFEILDESLHAMAKYYHAKECYLEVRVSNTQAINLYSKAGFTTEKTIKGYYADGENAFMMNKKLDFKSQKT